jgi:N6-L-threonylcarbamoyladenine synthase
MNVDEATLVLGIETSCDETAAALVMGGTDIVSSVVSTQVELHAEFGGVVPEIASRAHLQVLNPVIARAIVESGVDDARIDAVACTVGPGLVGALLVGVSAAKSLALAWDIPFVGVATKSVSIESTAHQWMKFYCITFHENRLKRLNSHTMQCRSSVK